MYSGHYPTDNGRGGSGVGIFMRTPKANGFILVLVWESLTGVTVPQFFSLGPKVGFTQMEMGLLAVKHGICPIIVKYCYHTSCLRKTPP
jgi:hypothetical protein